MLSFLANGMTFTGIGPLIPYLAENSDTTETKYSFVFSCRALGIVIGTLMFKVLQVNKTINYHQAIAISLFGTFLMCMAFTFSTSFIIQGVSFLINGFFFGVT
jgi:fucose permease